MERVLVYGGSGLVGSRFVELMDGEFEIVAPSHREVDVGSDLDLKANIRDIQPTSILYLVGYTNVDKAEGEPRLAFRLNADIPEIIANKAANLKIPLIYASTDYVFDGELRTRPYRETDATHPLGIYAQSKATGEATVMRASRQNCVARLIMPFRTHFEGKPDVVRFTLSRLQEGKEIVGIIDQRINPIFIDDLAVALTTLIKQRASGIYHLGAVDDTCAYDLYKLIARKFNLNPNLVKPTTFEEFFKTRPAPRPQYSWLDTTKFRTEFGEGVLQTISQQLDAFKQQVDS